MRSGILGFQQPPSLCPHCIIYSKAAPSPTTPPWPPMAPSSIFSEMPLCSYDYSLCVFIMSSCLPSASLAPLRSPGFHSPVVDLVLLNLFTLALVPLLQVFFGLLPPLLFSHLRGSVCEPHRRMSIATFLWRTATATLAAPPPA